MHQVSTFQGRATVHSGTTVRRKVWLSVAILALIASAIVLSHDVGLGFYGIGVGSIFLMKSALSLLPKKNEWPDGYIRVGVIVTAYNESPEYLRACIASIQRQTKPPEHIVVVDDYSSSMDTYTEAMRLASSDSRIKVLRHPENRGKREALATGFLEIENLVDVFACVDSDTVLDVHALERASAPFTDDEVTATTGTALAANYNRNILTRIIDTRYINAFLSERAAYSRLGSVLCVCGSLALYRADIVMKELAGFRSQKFLGEIATVGDDRHMTNLCLKYGKVLLVEDAISHTIVPEKINHYLRQQIRWGRSFFRESLWVLRYRRPNAIAWWLTIVELSQWFLYSSMLLWALALRPLLTSAPVSPTGYLLILSLVSFARSARVFDILRRDQTVWSQVYSFALSPLYSLMSIFVTLPLRLWSAVTMRKSAWGTRKNVESTTVPSSFHALKEGA